MKKFILSILFVLIPCFVFAQSSMRDYPLNSNPTDNDTLLGIDEQQDAVNWAVNNFTFSGIITYLNAQADYLRSAAAFTTANEILVATGSGRNVQRTPVLVDPSGNITNVESIQTNPVPDPEWCFPDSQNPSVTDPCVSWVGGNYITGTAGNDTGNLIFWTKIGGLRTNVGRFDSPSATWNFSSYPLSVLDEAYSDVGWNGSPEVPTKNAVRDKIESLVLGEVNDLVPQGTGESIKITKSGADIFVKNFSAGSGISVATVGNDIEIGNTQTPGEVNDGENVGTGTGNVYAGKSGPNIQLKSFTGGTGISITETPTDITVTNTAGGVSAVRDVGINVFDSDQDVQAITDTAGYAISTNTLNGLNLTGMTCVVAAPGSGTGTTNINVARYRLGAVATMMTTPVTIASGEYFDNDGVVDLTNDDVITGDRLKIFISSLLVGTAPQGLTCTMEFQ